MEGEQNMFVAVCENGTTLKEQLLTMGIAASMFADENTVWSCHTSVQADKVCLSFEKGAQLLFNDENAAADFLYMVICHGRFLQMLTTDFGGMMDILGGGVIHSTDWENREELPFYTSVLSTHVLPDVDDPEVSFQLMNETDDAMMERFSEDSQMILMFGDVEQAHRKLFWTLP